MDLKAIVKHLFAYTNNDNFESDLIDCYFADASCIDKKGMIALFRQNVSMDKRINDDNKKSICDYLVRLENDKSEFDTFLYSLKEYMIDNIYQSLELKRIGNNNPFDTMRSCDFWAMSIVAMKKCLGSKHAKATIVDKAKYYSYIKADLNDKQKSTHEFCMKLFAENANHYNIKKNPYLKLFLHSLGSSNNDPRTQAKNLKRVVRRIRKIMSVYQISHNGKKGNFLSEGRYHVPEQVATCLKKMFIDKR